MCTWALVWVLWHHMSMWVQVCWLSNATDKKRVKVTIHCHEAFGEDNSSWCHTKAAHAMLSFAHFLQCAPFLALYRAFLWHMLNCMFQLRANQAVTADELIEDIKSGTADTASVVQQYSSSLLSRNQARCNVVNEILTAERDYVKHLRDIVQVVYNWTVSTTVTWFIFGRCMNCGKIESPFWIS